MSKASNELKLKEVKARVPYPCGTDKCRDKDKGWCTGVCPRLRVYFMLNEMTYKEIIKRKKFMQLKRELKSLRYWE